MAVVDQRGNARVMVRVRVRARARARPRCACTGAHPTRSPDAHGGGGYMICMCTGAHPTRSPDARPRVRVRFGPGLGNCNCLTRKGLLCQKERAGARVMDRGISMLMVMVTIRVCVRVWVRVMVMIISWFGVWRWLW